VNGSGSGVLEAASSTGTSSALGTLLPLVLIVVAFWFLVIRPARRRQQDMTRIQKSVEVGSEVMLGSGIFGRVVSVQDDTITLAIAPGTEIKVARQAVVRVVDTPMSDGGGTGPGEGYMPERPTDTPEQP
jgi:preprotein translocase subunit YajC